MTDCGEAQADKTTDNKTISLTKISSALSLV